jgi:hypothetical protein
MKFDISELYNAVNSADNILESNLYFKVRNKISGESINVDFFKVLKPTTITEVNWYNSNSSTKWGRTGATKANIDRHDNGKMSIVISSENAWTSIDILSIIKAAFNANEQEIVFLLERKKSTGFGRYHITTPSAPEPDGVWEVHTSESTDLNRPYIVIEYV